ncbi:hypothetical protein GCM10007981_01000 [Thermocladium modestius]|uniref:DUF1616 domain-containing protein n=1 Tax=Thermocladium modestius TaxID=62609 RepID=A0A830GRP7_9CREN|nr:DUF1616 domain-containing protein [Thermocladium modestius]GGP19017.1 hypothetical protein GCM10007981_01000 [Thermocladium modestius]
MEIREYVMERVRRGGGGCVGVEELVEDVAREFRIPRSRAAYEVFMLTRQGAIQLDYPYDGVAPYFLTTQGLWYWSIIALTAASLASILLVRGTPLIYLRYALGALLVLFLPGYSLVEALYPRGDELSPLERLALSIGLSLAVEPLLGLILNYTPWGIRLDPILASTALLVTALTTTAAARKALTQITAGKCPNTPKNK